jgi:phage-related minor tail protein
MEPNEGLFIDIGANIAPFLAALREASRLSGRFASDLTRAFEDAALKGRSLADVLRQLAFSLSSQTLEAALAPLTKALGGGLAELVGGGLKSVSPFASGGVITSPVSFPLGARHLGLAGEAGPEAILPLTRGRDGRLGVRTEGHSQPINVTFNVTAHDAQSFRRSEGQIAAMLHRVVGRGARNL